MQIEEKISPWCFYKVAEGKKGHFNIGTTEVIDQREKNEFNRKNIQRKKVLTKIFYFMTLLV